MDLNLFKGKRKQDKGTQPAEEQAVGASAGSLVAKGLQSVRGAEFNLLRYFLFTSLWLFVVVLIFINHHESGKREFFNQVQEEQNKFLGGIQTQFAKTQEEEARKELLVTHESGNVNITRLFANVLWEQDFKPFLVAAQAHDVGECRAMPDVKNDQGKDVAPPEKKACFAAVGKKIMALPGFKEIDAKVFGMMKKSTVFKIKVFDLRGITIYSSEHKQIGEDKLSNAGWQRAAAGSPASELTRRDKFSAFEGVVENRDLISSYLPMYDPKLDMVVGVFEIYSDVTPLLAQIKEGGERIRKVAENNQSRMREVTAANQESVTADSVKGQIIIVLLLLVLFFALFFIVRNAHLTIKRQQQEKAKAQQQLSQSEKMASLGQMVAGVAHQLNTPLAFTKSNVEMAIEQIKAWESPVRFAARVAEQVRESQGNRLSLKSSREEIESIDASPDDVPMTCEMLTDVLHGVDQMAELVHHMRTFTRLDRSKIGEVDLNDALHSVVYIARSVIKNRIEVLEEYGDMQGRLCRCVPSQINQVVLNLVNNAAHAIGEEEGRIVIRTGIEGERFRVDVEDSGHGIPADVLPQIFDTYFTTKNAGDGTGLGLSIAKEIVDNHQGEITVESRPGCTIFTFFLPLHLDDSRLLA